MAASPHHLYPYRDNYPSDCFLGLLHYKFGDGFLAKAELASLAGMAGPSALIPCHPPRTTGQEL